MYCCCTRFYKHFVTIAELSYDTNKWKEKSLNAACTFYSKHKDKFTSPKNKLLAFLVKANQPKVKAYCEVGVTTLDTCNISAAVLLIILEDIAQNYPSYCSSDIPEICTIVLFLPF